MFGLQNQLQGIVTSKFTLRMCRLNRFSISKFSDFCSISKLNLILYQIFIVIEPKIKIQERYLYSFQLVSRCIQDPGFNVPECFMINFYFNIYVVNAF